MDFELFRLDSGLTVMHDRRSQQLTASIGLFILAAPVDETPASAGLAHLVEHMLLNGTHRMSAEDISGAFDLAGGHLQAFTAKEHTCLFSRVLATETRAALTVMLDLIMNPLFDPTLFQREKSVVAEEVRLGVDSPQRHVTDLAFQALWPRSALGRSILGAPGTVADLTPRLADDFHRAHYRPDRTVAVVSSPLPSEEIRDYFDRLAGKSEMWPDNQGPAAAARTPPRGEPGIVASRAETQQVHVCLSFEAPAAGDPTAAAATVLSTLLGGSVAGRLPRVLRREDALVYLVSTSFVPYAEGGIFQLYVGASPGNIGKALHLCLRELGRSAREAPSEAELHRARQRVKGALASSQEQPGDRTIITGRDLLLLGRVRGAAELLNDYDSLTAGDVLRVARTAFRPEGLACAVIGPVDWAAADLAGLRSELALAIHGVSADD
jgi:predicted Zn-dependent peptidase